MTTPTGDAPASPAPDQPAPPAAQPREAQPAAAGRPQPGPPAPGHPPVQDRPAVPGYPPAVAGYPPVSGYRPVPGYPPHHPAAFRWAPPAPTAPDGRRLAEFSDRLLARLIDAALLGAVFTVLLLPVVALTLWYVVGRASASDTPNAEFGAVVAPWLLMYAGVFLITLVVSYLYEVEYCSRKGGRTFGKQVMKIRIAPLDPAAVYHRGSAARRWLIMDVVSTFLPGFGYVDGLWQLGDKPYRQCLHDKYAATVVVKDPA